MTVSTEGHIYRRYDQELAGLRTQVLEMGGLVENQIGKALEALEQEDVTIAREVITNDRKVNSIDTQVDDEVVHLIAQRQPMGSDLRLIMTLAKAVSDLERIGDEAKKIARMVVQIYDSDSSSPSSRLFRDAYVMGGMARDMLRRSLDALARQDLDSATAMIVSGDDELNSEFQSALRRLMTYMMEDPRTIGHAINVLFIVKALERIGDHSKNIAEYVVFLIKGKDVRHGKEKRPVGQDTDEHKGS